MSSQLELKGLIMPPSTAACGGSGGCAGSTSQGCTFDLAFRNCFESYSQVLQGSAQIATGVGVFSSLALADQLTAIELAAIKTSGPIKVRINGAPASATTAALYPVAGLSGLTLIFTVDGNPLTVTFAAGDDTAADVARRINAEAALIGLECQVATVNAAGQVVISGVLTGPEGSLSVFTGTAAASLGLDTFVGALGTGATLDVDGLFVSQFPRGALSATKIEVSGTASLSVLVAGT